MDVVYIHKQKNSEEIIWSIKSVRKNLKHDNIYVVGDDPGVDGVIIIQPKKKWWSRLSKFHDQVNKYLTAAEHPDISEDFVVMNDDFFIMDPWKPYTYHRGSLKKHIESRVAHDPYRRSLEATRRYLDAQGKSSLSYELHTPMVFNKHKLRSLLYSIDMGINPCYQIRSLYGNTYDEVASYTPDFKNIEDFTEHHLLSTTEDYFTNKPIGQYIRDRLS